MHIQPVPRDSTKKSDKCRPTAVADDINACLQHGACRMQGDPDPRVVANSDNAPGHHGPQQPSQRTKAQDTHVECMPSSGLDMLHEIADKLHGEVLSSVGFIQTFWRRWSGRVALEMRPACADVQAAV